LAYLLGYVYGLKMVGVAIASSLHFCMKFTVTYCLVSRTPEYKKCAIPLKDPRSWEGLKDLHKIATQNTMIRVMGWWAFEIIT